MAQPPRQYFLVEAIRAEKEGLNESWQLSGFGSSLLRPTEGRGLAMFDARNTVLLEPACIADSAVGTPFRLHPAHWSSTLLADVQAVGNALHGPRWLHLGLCIRVLVRA